MFRTCQEVHVLQAGGVLLLEAREGCLELQLGDLTCHVPHYWTWGRYRGRDGGIRRRGRTWASFSQCRSANVRRTYRRLSDEISRAEATSTTRPKHVGGARRGARAHNRTHRRTRARARARVCSRTRGTRSKRARDSRQHNPRRHERTDCERLSWTVERRGPAPLRCSSLTTVVWWWRVTLDSRGWWEDDRAGRHSNRWLSAPMSRIISLRQGRPYRSKPFTFRDLFTEFTHIHGPIWSIRIFSYQAILFFLFPTFRYIFVPFQTQTMQESTSKTDLTCSCLLAVTLVFFTAGFIELPTSPDLSSVPCHIWHNFAHLSEIEQIDVHAISFLPRSCDYFCLKNWINYFYYLEFNIVR